MSEFTYTATLVILYRIVTALSGLAIVYLGYLLFKIGVFEKPAELKASWGDKNLLLKQAAPGTFFALFGAAVIMASLWRGVTFDRSVPSVQPETGGASRIADGFVGLADSVEGSNAGYAKVPDEIKTIIDKVTKNESLTPAEIAALQKFRVDLDKFTIHAWQDPSNIQVPAGFEGPRDKPTHFPG